LCLFLVTSLTACGDIESDKVQGKGGAKAAEPASMEAEPVYSNIAVMGENYLPYNLSRFTITDAYGNRASGGGDNPPGAGGGSTACCYSLRGTKFKVAWKYYDVDEWTPGEKIKYYTAESEVEYRPEGKASGPGSVLAVHIFPDGHVELQYPSAMMAPSRIPIVEVSRALRDLHPELNASFSDRGTRLRGIARTIAQAWMDYRITDQGDLEQYTYRALTLGQGFDRYPAMQAILVTAKDQPGEFKRVSESLPAEQVEAIGRFVRAQDKTAAAKARGKKEP
jgi:hypothetical protein